MLFLMYTTIFCSHMERIVKYNLKTSCAFPFSVWQVFCGNSKLQTWLLYMNNYHHHHHHCRQANLIILKMSSWLLMWREAEPSCPRGGCLHGDPKGQFMYVLPKARIPYYNGNGYRLRAVQPFPSLHQTAREGQKEGLLGLQSWNK